MANNEQTYHARNVDRWSRDMPFATIQRRITSLNDTFQHSYLHSNALFRLFSFWSGPGAVVSVLVLPSKGRWFDPPFFQSFGWDFRPRCFGLISVLRPFNIF